MNVKLSIFEYFVAPSRLDYAAGHCEKYHFLVQCHKLIFADGGGASIETVEGIMVKPLSADDITAMEDQLRSSVEADRQYWRVNDVKCDAIHTASTYEEFADRVAAAHLQPLEKKDFDKKRRGWNQFAQEKSSD